MPTKFLVRAISIVMVTGSAAIMNPEELLACGCGCNAFSVGNRWMMASSSGLKMSLQYSYMDQNTNWDAGSSAPAEANADKELRTHYATLGFQYMANREWGGMIEVPMWNRYFATIGENGAPESTEHTSLGDVRIMGMYSGLSEDMSTAILFGVKLPTGAFNQSLFDRDTQIGTGTTDLLLGMYQIWQKDTWGWYINGIVQHALNTRDEYKPGDSFDVSLGLHYDGFVETAPFIPTVQLVGSFRGHDSGAQSHPDETGYERLFIAPGFEILATPTIQFFADFRIPIVTHVTGNQLIAPTLLNITSSIAL